jgi:perosamine synthetase
MRERPFHKPFIMEDELNEVADTLKKGWLTMGPKTIEFEKAFKKQVKAKHAVSVNSCTAALHLSLKVIDLKENDEVIIPSMTFAATGEVVRYFNARPVIVDVDKGTHNILVDEIERNITPRTKAIIPIHFGGHSAEMDEISEIAQRHNLRVIEDAAHCFPSFYKGKPVGSISDITAFSFYATKTIAMGEGGIAATNSEEFAERMSILRLHGISKDAWKRYGKGAEWYYEIVEVGYKYNMTDIQAALGLAQLKKTGHMQGKRNLIAQKYNEAFKDSPYLIIPTVKDYVETSWHLYVIKLKTEKLKISRDQFINELQNRGIGVSVHFIPLHRHPYYKDTLNLNPENFRNSEWLYERIISLPIFPGMSQDDVDYVIENVLQLANRHGKRISRSMNISLSSPDITEKEQKAVMEVLKTPNLSFGPTLEVFERQGAKFAGRKYGVAVNSGTSGLHLIIKSLDISEGDRVITTPFSFVASANCMLYERAVPVFVDIDENTLNFSPEKIEDILKKDRKKKVKAILAVDIFGHPAQWDALYDISKKYNLKLIEDSAEAVGSEYCSPEGLPRRRWNGYRKAGSFGDVSVFAFYPNKQVTTGEGGLILTDNKKIYDLCKSLRNQGRGDGSSWLNHLRLGYNYRLSDINCALGVAQMLKSIDGIRPPFCAPNIKIGWFVYVIRLGKEFRRKNRDVIVEKLRKRGIESSNYFSPIHLQPFYRKEFGYKRGDFPVTEHVADRTIALPFYNNLKESEIEFVVDSLKEILQTEV